MKLGSMKFCVTNNHILASLVVLMFFIIIQFASAQTDYRTFNSYNSKEFSLLYPPSWHIWNSTASYSQPGTEQITIANEMIGNKVVDMSNFPTKIQVTVIPSVVTGIISEDILSNWIDNSYSPQNQRKYGMYALEDNPTLLQGITTHKISYNIDYVCGNSNIVTHNVVMYSYIPNSENTYVISFIEPLSKPQFDSVEVQSVIKSFEMKHFVDVDRLIDKVHNGTATMTEAWQAFDLGVQRSAGTLTDGSNPEVTPVDTYGNLDHITNTPIPAIGHYLSLPYTSNPPRC